MRSLFACACVVLLAMASQASANLLLYDGFQYDPGLKLAEWGGSSAGSPNDLYNVQYNQYWRYAGLHGRYGDPMTVDAPHINSGSLSVPGMPAPLGNSVGFDELQVATARIAIPGGVITSGTVYWSGFLRVNSVNTLTTATGGLLISAFNNSTGAQETAPTALGALLKIRKDGSDPNGNSYFVGTSVNNSSGFVWSPAQTAGSTVFVVASYSLVSGSNNDVVKMWVNPSSLDFGAASEPTPTLTSTGIADPFLQIASYNLRNVNTVGAPDFQFDELRIGTAWADVTTPEPASMLLIAAGAAGLIAWRKR